MKEIYIKIGRTVILLMFCFILWMLLSLEWNILSLTGGFFLSIIASIYSYNIFFAEEYYRSDLFIRVEYFLLYAIILVIQSYYASFELMYRIVSGNYKPQTVRIRLRLHSKIGRTFMANTISMIPGTLSLWLEGNHIFVHWFDCKTDHSTKAGIIIKQDFERILQRIFG